MKRSLLFIVMAIGFVAAYVGGATFAPFTADKVATTAITSGTIEFSEPGDETITFSSTDLDDCTGDLEGGFDGVYPGEVCTAELDVTNAGSLSAYFVDPTIVITPPTETDCDPSNWQVTIDITDGSGSPLSFHSGDNSTIHLALVLLASAPNECQGETVDVEITIGISQSPNPHVQTDTGANVGTNVISPLPFVYSPVGE